MLTAHDKPRLLSDWRNGALMPYPPSARTQPKRTPCSLDPVDLLDRNLRLGRGDLPVSVHLGTSHAL
jgi:hypothetical protein